MVSGGARPAFWCFLAALVANVFAGNWGDMGVPFPPDRLLFPFAILLAVLDPRSRLPRGRAVYLAMLLLTWWACVSAVAAGALGDRTALFALLDRVVMPFLLFACAPVLLSTSLERRWFLRIMTGLGLYLAATTLLEAAGMTQFLFPRYIAVDVIADAASTSGEPHRAGGPFLHGEANGMAVAMCGVLAALSARVERGPWFALAGLVAVLAPAASILSLTRSVWLGLVLAGAFVVLLHRPLRRWIPSLVIVGVVSLGIGAAMLPDVVESVAERGSTSRSLYDRANSNAGAVRAVLEQPVAGVGWGRFVHLGPDYVRQDDEYPVTTVDIEVHNVVLSRAAELGVPAVLVLVYTLVAGSLLPLMGHAGPLQEWRLAVIAITVLWLVPAMLSPVPYTFPTFIFYTLSGWFFAARHDMSVLIGPPTAARSG